MNFYSYVGNDPTAFFDPTGLKPKGCDCLIPDHPINSSVDDNIREVLRRKHLSWVIGPIGSGLLLDWWYNQVRNKGAWDYKQAAKYADDFGRLPQGAQSPYDDYGNFNYGATAAALGLTPEMALVGGGYAATRAHPETSGTTFSRLFNGTLVNADDFSGQLEIIAGYEYYIMGCYQ
jgi:hypothetical protein